MAYELEIPEPVEKEICKKLEKHLIERLNKRIRKLEEDPKIGKPLRKPLAGI